MSVLNNNAGSLTTIDPDELEAYMAQNGIISNGDGSYTYADTGAAAYILPSDVKKFARKNGMSKSAFSPEQFRNMGNNAAALDSGVRALPSFPQESSGAAAANGLFDNAASIMDKIPGAEKYAAAIKMAKFAGDIGAAVGLTNDGMTGIDQFTQTGVGNLVGGMLLGNNIFTKKTQDFGADEETLESVGGSYGGTANEIYAAADKAGKKYGWMSGRRRKKDDRKITEAKFRQRQLEQISRDASDQHDLVNFMGDAARSAYATRLMGGYDPSAIHVGEEGGKIDLKEKRRMTGDGPQIWILPQEDEGLSCPVMQEESESMTNPDDEMVIIVTEEPDVMPVGIMQGMFADGSQPEEGCSVRQEKECPFEKKAEEVADKFVPEIVSLAEAIAKETIMEMKEEMPCGPTLTSKRPTRRKTADGLDIILSLEPAFEPEIIPPFIPEIISAFTPELVEHGNGFSYSSGMSRSETTRNIPGIGPVTVVEERRMKPQFRMYGMSYKSGGRMAKREKIEKQLDAPQIEESGQMNIIPEGSLHKNRHHMDGAEDYTKKGIPVVDLHGPAEQEAEIEREEIIFNKEVTNALEELYAVYYDEGSTPEEKDEAALEAGKLITREVMLNTDDRTGLIGRMKRGGVLHQPLQGTLQ